MKCQVCNKVFEENDKFQMITEGILRKQMTRISTGEEKKSLCMRTHKTLFYCKEHERRL